MRHFTYGNQKFNWGTEWVNVIHRHINAVEINQDVLVPMGIRKLRQPILTTYKGGQMSHYAVDVINGC